MAQVMSKVSDELAGVLLEKIHKDREKNQKGKKQEFKSMAEDEKPFDIPVSWALSDMKTITNVAYGKGLSKKHRIEGPYPVISSAGIVGTHTDFMFSGPIIVTGRKGTLSKPHLIEEKSWVIDTAFAIASCKDIEARFIYWLLNKVDLIILQSSTAIPSLTRESLYKVNVPLPPKQEQQRIVQKIESCFEKIDRTQKNLKQVETLLEKCRSSLLAKAFKGQLVEQNKSDEPASILLEKIRKEREKNQKGEKKEQEFKSITDEEKPFDIPESWAESTLEFICSKVTDGTHYTPDLIDRGYPFVTVKHVKDGVIDFSNVKYISKDDYEKLKENCNPLAGDILFSKDGTVGKVTQVDFEKKFIVLSSLAILRPSNAVKSNYLRVFMKSSNALKQAVKKKTGSAIKRIVLRDLRTVKLPIPPLKEQKRIVQKIESCFKKIDSTQENLNQVKILLERYKSSLLAKAFRGELVDQIKSEGTGHELLEQILASKEKKSPKKKTKKNR